MAHRKSKWLNFRGIMWRGSRQPATCGRRTTLGLERLEERVALAVEPVEQFRLFTSPDLQTAGLVGSYVNRSLRDYPLQDDWRASQTISGTRIDQVSFVTDDWGSRAAVGVTGGSDANWENFSVQWDGYIQIRADNVTLLTRSDDGSRLWIDVNNDGQFAATLPEFADNGWGTGHATADGQALAPLAKGVYRIRMQYEDGAGGNRMELVQVPLLLRIAYLIPVNREPQGEGVKNLQQMARWYRDYLSEQMAGYGYDVRTLQFETETDGVTPKVHVLTMPLGDAYYRADDEQNDGRTIYSRVLEGATAAGAAPFKNGEVWLYVHEAHHQLSDGKVVGGVALGAGFGNGYSGGVAVVGGAMLSFADAEGLADVRPYDGLVIPQIGPYSLKQDISFPWFAGNTISSVASGQVGAALHELMHGVGVGHDFRNDANFHGNLMGNGLRGFRSFVWPEQFPDDYVRLGPAEALRLGLSRFLHRGQTITDNVAPVIGSFTADAQPQGGLLIVSFTASDNSGLGGAMIGHEGAYVAETALAGTAASFAFQVPYYDPGSSNPFELTVMDAQGNRAAASLTVTPTAPSNRAPIPRIKASTYKAQPGQAVTLDATDSSDPDHSSLQLSVQWDLNGDGTFDTPSARTFTTASLPVGFHKIHARVTDPAGASSLSAPIIVRVVGPDPSLFPWHNFETALDVDASGGLDPVSPLDALIIFNLLNRQPQPIVVPPGTVVGVPFFYDTNRDNNVSPIDALLVINDINSASITHEGEDSTTGSGADQAEVEDIVGMLAVDAAEHFARRRRSL